MRPFYDENEKVERFPGDQYLFHGPGTYIPRIEEDIVEQVKSIIIRPNTSLVLKAKRDLVDSSNKQRRAGERVRSHP